MELSTPEGKKVNDTLTKICVITYFRVDWAGLFKI